jgi:hypothetical protein
MTAPDQPIDRPRALANSIRQHVAQGWRVESQTDTDAILVRGQRCNHVLHLILSLVTFGIWAIVWIIMAIISGERRMSISVDEFGNTLVSAL